jgi:hypothetical protein
MTQLSTPFPALPDLPWFPGKAAPGRFNPDDPYKSLARITGGGRAAADDPAPVTPEEEQTYLGETMGAVQAIGNVLDTPGSVVRGAIGAGLDALQGNTPNAHLEGVLYPSKRIYGSDLLTKLGVPEAPDWSGENYGLNTDNLLHAGRGLLGFGVDVATDPLSMIGIGTKTAAGVAKVAESASEISRIQNTASHGADALKALNDLGIDKLGAAAETWSPKIMADELRSGDRAALNFHLPWWMGDASKKPFASVGEGGAIGNKAADLVEAAGYGTYSPLKIMRGLFSSQASPEVTTFDGGKQIANDEAFAANAKARAALLNLKGSMEGGYASLGKSYQDIASHFQAVGDQDNFNDFMRAMQTNDGLSSAADIGAEVEKALKLAPGQLGGLPQETDAFTKAAWDYRTELRRTQDNVRQYARAAGVNVGELNDLYAAFSHRSAADVVAPLVDEGQWHGWGYGRNPTINRNDALRDIPGSEVTVNNIAKAAGLMGYDAVPKNADLAAKVAAASTDAEAEALMQGLSKNDFKFERIAKGDLADSFRGQLGKAATDTSTVADLQQELAVHNHIEPALDHAWKDKTWVPMNTDGTLDVPKKIDPVTGGATIDESKLPPGVKMMGDGEDATLHNYWTERKRWNMPMPANHGLTDPNEVASATALLKDGDYLSDKGGELMKTLNGMKPEKVLNGVYGNTTVKDAYDYAESLLMRAATMKSAQQFLARPGVVADEGVPLLQAWKDAGPGEPGGKGLEQRGLAQAVQAIPEANQQFQKAVSEAMQSGTPVDPDAIARDVAQNVNINPWAAKGLTAYADMASPAVKDSVWDRYNTALKSTLYAMWPASHLRDLMSRVWNASTAGNAPLLGEDGIMSQTLNVAKYVESMGKEGIEEPADISRIKAAGIGQSFSALDTSRNPALARANHIPTTGFVGSVLPWEGTTMNPLSLPGIVSDADIAAGKPIFGPVKAGMNLQSYGDFVAQGGYFLALVKKGFTDAQAKSLVDQAFYTGDKLSPFEKNLLSKIMPFERFTVRNVPYQLSKLATEPGGQTAETLRALNEASSQQNKDVYTPNFLREGQPMAIGNDPTKQGFLRNTLVPLHELNDAVFQGVSPDLGRTAEKVASRLNPLLSSPIEYFAGKELHTGREFSNLESTTGALNTAAQRVYADPAAELSRQLFGSGNTPEDAKLEAIKGAGLPFLDSLIHNTPASRPATELTGAIDDRKNLLQKAANLLGLGHFSNYDTTKFERTDAQNALAKEATEEGAKPWTNYYLPKNEQAQMTPEQIQKIEEMLRRREALVRYGQQQRDAQYKAAQQ